MNDSAKFLPIAGVGALVQIWGMGISAAVADVFAQTKTIWPGNTGFFIAVYWGVLFLSGA